MDGYYPKKETRSGHMPERVSFYTYTAKLLQSESIRNGTFLECRGIGFTVEFGLPSR